MRGLVQVSQKIIIVKKKIARSFAHITLIQEFTTQVMLVEVALPLNNRVEADGYLF